MSTHSIGFYEELRKIVTDLSPKVHCCTIVSFVFQATDFVGKPFHQLYIVKRREMPSSSSSSARHSNIIRLVSVILSWTASILS